VLASAGADGVIHIWDVRSHRTPSQSLSAGPGRAARLVAWNRERPEVLASAHGEDVWLWDTRRASSPSSSPSPAISSFCTRGGGVREDAEVSSLSWRPGGANELLTCARDGAVRLWDLGLPSSWPPSDPAALSAAHRLVELAGGRGPEPTGATMLAFSLEDASGLVRWSPFGDRGLVSVGGGSQGGQIVPGQSAAGKAPGPQPDTLYLWACPPPSRLPAEASEAPELVQAFQGHAAPVLAMDWRAVEGLVFQLVSLDTHGSLRLWRLEPWMLRACGHASAVTSGARRGGKGREEAAVLRPGRAKGVQRDSLSQRMAERCGSLKPAATQTTTFASSPAI
jgi:WD40 repeat protein